VDEIIEHKIMKVNGETGYKRYKRGKLLGKGTFTIIEADSLNVTKDLILRPMFP
jgi:hypothetical protein